MSFIKNILASIIGFWIAIGIVVIIGIGVIASLTMDEVVVVKENSILEIDLSGSIKDYVPTEESPLVKILGVEEQVGFNQVVEVIRQAQYDSKIKAISLKSIPFDIGWAQTSELRKALDTFKKSGKSVWAYGDVYSQKNYYLASVANKVALSPVGSVELNGIHSEVLFYKDFQEKYGVKMEVIRHGKYKSAVEPFLANKMSDANKTQISELIHSIWKQVKTDIETSRNFDSETAVNNLYGRLPKIALENGLVDAVVYEDEYFEQIKSAINQEVQTISFEDYMFNNLSTLSKSSKQDKVAVIYAQGDIIYGKGDENSIGQELMIDAITKAVEDETIKTIVLRVNSPGGSALASDLIWNAIEKAKKEKPVIVSMGNLAASGGYYIACNANKIYAEPTTITGSIGVFGILPNVAKISKENGISAEVVSTHNNGSHYSVVQPIDTKFKNTVTEGVEFIYDTFVDRVAQGRNMTIATVDSLAQGRVWTGAQAKSNGLVDELGSLDDAITFAATAANLSDYEVEEFPKYEMDFKSMLLGGPLMKTLGMSTSPLTQKMVTKLDQLEQIFKLKGIQARMPFEMVVE